MDPDKGTKAYEKENRKGRSKTFKNLNSGNLIRHLSQVISNSFLIAFFNIAFQLIMSRKLGPEQYGELQTLMTINSIVLIVLASIGFVVAKFVSYYKTRQQYDKMKFLAQWSFIFFFILGGGAFIITVMLSRLVADYLNIVDYTIIVIFGIYVWVNFLIPIVDGILRGLQEFKFVGRDKIIESFSRILFGVILVYAGFGLKSIIGGLAAASAITTIVCGYILKKIYINKPYKIEMREIYLFAVPVFFAFLSYAILSNIDIILVKHFFDAKTTGYFAAAGAIAKTMLSISFGSAGVMFPKIIEYYSNGNKEKMLKMLKNTLKITTILGVILTAIIAIFPEQIVYIFFGHQYVTDYMLSVYVIATLLLSIATVLMMYDLAVKKYDFLWIFAIGAFIEIYQIYINHNTIYDVVWTLLVINAIILVYMIIYNRKILIESMTRTRN